METKYKIDISFTYVDEINAENERPGSCDIDIKLFERFFQLAFTGCEMLSYEKKGYTFECIFQTSIEYRDFMMKIPVFRFKVSGKLAKVADISIIVV